MIILTRQRSSRLAGFYSSLVAGSIPVKGLSAYYAGCFTITPYCQTEFIHWLALHYSKQDEMEKKNLHIYLHHYSLIQFYAICVVRVTVKLHLTSRLTRNKKHIYFLHILWTLVWVNATTRNINLEKKKYLPHANLLKCLPLSKY